MRIWLTLLFSVTVSMQAFGWGSSGHRIVGYIAEMHLNQTGRDLVKKLMGNEKLSHAAVWADEIKSDRKKSNQIATRWWDGKAKEGKVSINHWHYVSIPHGMDYDRSPKDSHGDIVWAMRKMDQVIRSPKARLHHRREALKLLAHYVGDIHQPLHAGIKNDRGGNYCWVRFFPEGNKNIDPIPSARPNYVNLHALWDTAMIESSKLSFSDYAAKINSPAAYILAETKRELERQLDEYTPAALKQYYDQRLGEWKNSNYIDWVHESVKIRKLAYPENTEVAKGETSPRFCYSSRNTNVKAESIPKISYGDVDNFRRVMDYRLLQAGIRLAHAINQLAIGKSLIK